MIAIHDRVPDIIHSTILALAKYSNKEYFFLQPPLLS